MPSSRLAGRSRRARLSSFVVLACLFASALALAQPIDRAADALLAIDQQRASVVERIVATWGPTLAKSSAPVSVDDLRARLLSLRADHLFTASLAGPEEGLREVTGFPATTAATKPVAYAKALGDAAIDVVYTPVTPCRLVETRGTFAAVYQGNGTASHTPVPFASNEVRTYTVQDGNGICLSQLPGGLNPSAVQLQVFGMPTTSASGDIEILPQGATFGSTATMVYVSTIQFNTVSTAAKINTGNHQISVQVRGGGAHLAIDVVGYFAAPSGNGGKFFRQGGNGFGTAASLGTTDNQAMTLIANNQPVMTYLPNTTSPNLVGGHPNNSANASSSAQTIAGGGFAGTECQDTLTSPSTRSCANHTGGIAATVGGGFANFAGGDSGVVAGGESNTASGFLAAVSGGGYNRAAATSSTVIGGQSNAAMGISATVLGGFANLAQGSYSVAAGRESHAVNQQSFVWNGWTNGSAGSFRDNVFQIHGEAGLDVEYGARRADGGGTSWVYIGSVGFPGQAIATSTGAFLSSGGQWINNSDRSRKTRIAPIDVESILSKVSALPIGTWQYVDEDPSVRHIGPMAQDFHAAFAFGGAPTSIGTVDADGVALAAIQGLNAKLEQKIAYQRQQIAALEDRVAEVAALREQVAALEALVVGRRADAAAVVVVAP